MQESQIEAPNPGSTVDLGDEHLAMGVYQEGELFYATDDWDAERGEHCLPEYVSECYTQGEAVPVFWSAHEAFRLFKCRGLPLPCRFHCVQTMNHLLGESIPQDLPTISDLWFEDSPDDGEEAAPYLLHLYSASAEYLKKEGLWKLYHDVELPLIRLAVEMESGFRIDTKKLHGLIADQERSLETLRQKIFHSWGDIEINLNSHKQVADMLFGSLGLKSNHYRSTDETALSKITDQHACIPLLIEYRKQHNLLSSFTGITKRLVDSRLSYQIGLTGAVTGRWTSENPALQNTSPAAKELFLPEEGHIFIYADLSQAELRVLAALSEEPALVNAFKEGKDLHAITASKIYGVSLGKVDDAMRQGAKAFNFGILYGRGPTSIANELGISEEEAQTMIDLYFQEFPRVKAFRDQITDQAVKELYVREPVLGRRRHFYQEDLTSGISQVKRQAFNFMFQGAVGSIMKTVMLDLERLGVRIYLQIHDALLMSAPTKKVDQKFLNHIRETMESSTGLSVKPRAVITTGKSWGDCVKS